jgi:UDP-GlcNAc:undecaprenyl-phosphate/decaprenyl-phosphate GlcNAc-1-phosphate transferase
VSFPTNVYLAAVVSAWVTAAATLPLWRRWCLRIGLLDDPGHRKIHDQPVPLAGGFAVLTGILLPILAAALVLLWRQGGAGSPEAGPAPGASYLLAYGLRRRATELGGVLAGALGMLLVGSLDDRHELRPAPKFAGQLAVAALAAASGVRITLFIPIPVVHYALTILWILTVVNAFNFLDNMNGLCAGLGAIGAVCFAADAAADGQYLVALIAFLALGALLGFVPYNFPRARAFLGDAGSHLVGYLLAVLAILPHFYTRRHQHKWAVLVPLLVLAVPLLDLTWVVVSRWRKGQPFYIGDTNHLSHRLVRRGLSRTQAVVAIWLLAGVMGGLSFLL